MCCFKNFGHLNAAELLLADKIDQQVQDYIKAIYNGGIINNAIVLSIGNAALLSQDKSRQKDHDWDIHTSDDFNF